MDAVFGRSSSSQTASVALLPVRNNIDMLRAGCVDAADDVAGPVSGAPTVAEVLSEIGLVLLGSLTTAAVAGLILSVLEAG